MRALEPDRNLSISTTLSRPSNRGFDRVSHSFPLKSVQFNHHLSADHRKGVRKLLERLCISNSLVFTHGKASLLQTEGSMIDNPGVDTTYWLTIRAQNARHDSIEITESVTGAVRQVSQFGSGCWRFKCCWSQPGVGLPSVIHPTVDNVDQAVDHQGFLRISKLAIRTTSTMATKITRPPTKS